MKTIKQFCVACNSDQSTVVKEHKTSSMLHCQRCGEEVCRIEDAHPHAKMNRVKGGLDTIGIPWEVFESLSPLGLATHYPDRLSDEHAMWQPRDEDAEWGRHLVVNEFVKAFKGFTRRQQQIVYAVQTYGTQERAAKALGVDAGTVRTTMSRLRKKCQRFA